MQGLFYLFDTTLLLVKIQSSFLGDHFLYNILFLLRLKKANKHLKYLLSLFCDQETCTNDLSYLSEHFYCK